MLGNHPMELTTVSLLLGLISGAILRWWQKAAASWWLPVFCAAAIAGAVLGTGANTPLTIATATFAAVAGLSSRHPHRLVREFGTVIGALLVSAAGLRVDAVKMPFTTQFVALGAFSIPLTTLWLWLFTALMRPTARLKGLPWSVAVLSGLTFALIVVMTQLQPALALALSLTAVGIGVALWGLPAEAGGAASLGALLAMTSVAGALKNTAFLVFIAPALALGLPVLEVSYRLRTGGFALPTQRRSLFDLLTAEGVDERRAFWLLTVAHTVAHGYLCLLALLLVRWIEVHFSLKLLIMAVWLFVGVVAFWIAVRFSARKAGKGVVNLLGVPVAAVTMEETLDILERFIPERRTHLVVTSDASALVRAQEDEEFRRIVQNADLVTPDGIGVVWSARLLGLPVYERVPGVELMAKLCERAAQKGWRVFLKQRDPTSCSSPLASPSRRNGLPATRRNCRCPFALALGAVLMSMQAW